MEVQSSPSNYGVTPNVRLVINDVYTVMVGSPVQIYMSTIYPNIYQDITVDNFYPVFTGSYKYETNGSPWAATQSLAYDPSTGLLTYTAPHFANNSGSHFEPVMDVYLIY